jgi:hypothetical protein
MSCCGGKRAQLSQAQPPRAQSGQAPIAVAELPAPRERKARTFEYVGRGSLTVRGAVSGTAYRFAQTGDRIEVAADDAFAMMAERDVRPAAGSRA